jgi:SSS family solute:Na+ symporter
MSLALGVLLGYAALQVVLGLWIGRNVKGSADFFVAGRRLGPGLLFSTLVAANIGAGSTVGATGLGFRDGIASWWWVGSAGIGSLILAFLVGPRMRQVAAKYSLSTVGDYLELRYSKGVRGIVVLLLWFGTLTILAGQLVAAGKILHVVTGLPAAVGSIIGGVAMTAYFTAGGLMGAVWVNVLQLIVEVGVYCVLIPVAVSGAGGWGAVVAMAPADPSYWTFWQGGGSGWKYLIMLAPAFVISPGLLQKVYGAKDDRSVRIGVGLNALLLLAFAFVPAILGIVARALHPTLTDHELALPTLLLNDLPPVLGALGLAAAFTTDINTADAVLFMLSTSLAQDLYKGFLKPAATDLDVLRVARGAAMFAGALGVAFAVAAPSVIGSLSIFYTLLSVCLFVPIIAGLFFPRVETREAMTSMTVGVLLTLILHLSTGGKGYGVVTPALLGIGAAALTCAAMTAFRSKAAQALLLLAVFVMCGCVHGPQARPKAAVAPPPAELLGEFQDDYGSAFRISATEWVHLPRSRYHIVIWDTAGQYLIARNDEANSSAPGLWTRIDWVALPGMAPYTWAFCMSAYEAPSREAAEATSIARRETPKTGCNGFPFSRMRRQ